MCDHIIRVYVMSKRWDNVLGLIFWDLSLSLQPFFFLFSFKIEFYMGGREGHTDKRPELWAVIDRSPVFHSIRQISLGRFFTNTGIWPFFYTTLIWTGFCMKNTVNTSRNDTLVLLRGSWIMLHSIALEMFFLAWSIFQLRFLPISLWLSF